MMIFPIVCPECEGSKERPAIPRPTAELNYPNILDRETCTACNGLGFVRVSQDWVDGLNPYPTYVAVGPKDCRVAQPPEAEGE